MSDAEEAPSQVDANNSMGNKEEDMDLEAGKGLELPAVTTASSQSNLSSSPQENNNNGGSETLPPFFTCPLTKQLLQDPVVLKDGISYERQAVVDRNEAVMYPNRSLKAILTECMASSSSSSTSPTATTPSAINATASKQQPIIIPKHSLLQQAKRFFAAEEDRPLPNAFYCPITLGLMHKPVIDPQGYTYERLAIYKWIEVNGDSPVTRAPLTVDQLVPNHALEGLLQAEANRENAEDIHPVILKWKKEASTMVFDIPIISSVRTSSSNLGAGSDTASARAVPFPTTPEELERQQSEARRRRLQKRLCRLSLILIFIALVVAGFFFPPLAAVLVVVVIFIMWYAMSSSARSDRF